MILFNLNLTDWKVLLVDAIIIFIIATETYSGYKKGFLESSIKLLGFIGAFIGAYILKSPLSVFMYTHLPFFKFDGLFKGVSSLNIIVYEVLAFIVTFIVLRVAIKVVARLLGLVERLLSFIFFIGVPSKILGALVGFIKSIIILYFASFVLKFGCNFMNIEIKESLADDIISIPVLKNVFGDTLSSFDEITSIAKDYEDTKDKTEFNDKAIDILLKYNVITKENLQILIDNDKIKSNDEQQKS